MLFENEAVRVPVEWVSDRNAIEGRILLEYLEVASTPMGVVSFVPDEVWLLPVANNLLHILHVYLFSCNFSVLQFPFCIRLFSQVLVHILCHFTISVCIFILALDVFTIPFPL